MVVLPIEEDYRDAIQKLAEGLTELSAAGGHRRIENPATLQLVLQSGCAGVIERPIRPFGLLTQLLLARTAWRRMLLAHASWKTATPRSASRGKTLLIASEGITEQAHRTESRHDHARLARKTAQAIINELS